VHFLSGSDVRGPAPRALDRVWNLDALQISPHDFLNAASKIRGIYLTALPEVADGLISDDALHEYVTKLVAQHPAFSPVSKWRVVVSGTVGALVSSAEGEPLRPPDQAYEDVMARLRGQ